MTLNLTASHALIDGFPMAEGFNKTQEIINTFEEFININKQFSYAKNYFLGLSQESKKNYKTHRFSDVKLCVFYFMYCTKIQYMI